MTHKPRGRWLLEAGRGEGMDFSLSLQKEHGPTDTLNLARVGLLHYGAGRD